DVIAVDSVFSPIVRVNYQIEDTRVGHATDYNKLTLEIWTDGSILPQDAVVHAARILKDHLNIFSTFDEEPEEQERVVDAEKERLTEYLTRSVDELELSVRSANCLKNSTIQYLWQLVQKTEAEMLKTKNFGRKSLNEIKEILGGMNLHFGMKLDDIPGGPWSPKKKPEER
ncbi:MAG: DNA-directed RNA polymerase subunit alpha C-terminal domain-containing protein, partial [Candidatus Methylomirabilales bacterium]